MQKNKGEFYKGAIVHGVERTNHSSVGVQKHLTQHREERLMKMGKVSGSRILFSIFLMVVVALWAYPRISEGACGLRLHRVKTAMKLRARRR